MKRVRVSDWPLFNVRVNPRTMEAIKEEANERAIPVSIVMWRPLTAPTAQSLLRFAKGGDVNSDWPHRDGLKWPRRSGRGAVCRRSWRLAPEDAGGVAVELGEQVVDSVRRCE